MPRNLDTAMATAISAKFLCPIVLVDLDINNETLHIWSGVGNFPWNGNTYTGVGDLGQVTPAREGIDIQANGASLSLSGVDPALVNAALSDIQLGAPATIWLGAVNEQSLQLEGAPVVMFSGLVDAPSVNMAIPDPNATDGVPAQAAITIPLESRLAMLGAGQQRKYSRADQNLTYPDDTAFIWVSLMNYLALKWNP